MNETEQRDYSPNIENKVDFQVRRPTRIESQKFNGLADSTHRVEKKVDANTGQLVLEKHIGIKGKEKIAKKETDILKHLESQETKTKFSRLASDEIVIDSDGNPTIFIAPDVDFVPFISDDSFFDEIVESDNPVKFNRAIEAIYEMHQHGVKHSDLHLDNIGQVPPKVPGKESNIMIIDFDQGELFLEENGEYIYPSDMIDDLSNFCRKVLNEIPTDSLEESRQKMIESVSNIYGQNISIDNLAEEISIVSV